MSKNMEQALLQRFQRLVTTHTGLQIREQEREVFGKTLSARIKALQFTQPEKYYQLLETGAAQGEAGESEWKRLIALLTNQESYFFRDKGQFALLKTHILPELIKRNQGRRTLRLWSAGCSTGEEPYSLAMLVDQLLPQRDGWNIFILGTDIKEAALEKARRAIYSPWSFRLVEPALQQHYFCEQQADYELAGRIRDMVTFRRGNLFADEFPNPAAGLYDMDLILCRNVFIYFDWNAVSVVLDKFSGTLNDGGYLMTGHAELNTQNVRGLQPRVLPGAVVHQRPGKTPSATPVAAVGGQTAPLVTHTPASFSSVVAPLAKNTAPISQVSRQTVESQSQSVSGSSQRAIARPEEETEKKVAPNALSSDLEEAEALFGERLYGAAAEKLEHFLRSEPQNYAALCLAARAYANLGRHNEADQLCRRAIAVDTFGPIPYSLLAHIAEEQGDSEEAKILLKKVIYLAPSFTPAFLELRALYEKEGDLDRSQKMRAAALELLQALTPKTIVEPYGLAAQEIIGQLQ